MDYIILNNGVKMPKLGFGTINQFESQITENVSFALNNGYQLIDRKSTRLNSSHL